MTEKPEARIMIVDDEPALMKSVSDVLRHQGYETAGFISASTALVAMRATPFDLLLTDLTMPGMDGIALLQAAQKLDANLVSVLMTGAGSVASAVKAMKAGALDYITKPFELSAILPVLTRALEVRRLRMENAALARRVTDRTLELEAANRALRASEEQLRTLANWAVQAQEDERAGLALTLHDNITQLLCAIQVRTHALLDHLPAGVAPAKREARKLRDLLGNAAEEVESISRNLRPGVLDILGLAAVLRDTGADFARRTSVAVQVDCAPLPGRLPGAIELALYRIFQIALSNVEQHADARCVILRLETTGDAIQLTIKDDGVGFEPDTPCQGKETRGIGLIQMRERAAYVGGVLTVKSAPNTGTEINVRIPQGTLAEESGAS
jgi:signal transduction histidine kinase